LRLNILGDKWWLQEVVNTVEEALHNDRRKRVRK
jgi:hypothetical protein